ncbi:hypothetical protein C8J56DRAFT_586076, partial [Mycena floridula]
PSPTFSIKCWSFDFSISRSNDLYDSFTYNSFTMRSTSVAIACIILGATCSLAVLEPNVVTVNREPSDRPFKLKYNDRGEVIHDPPPNSNYGGGSGHSGSVVSTATSGRFGGSFASGYGHSVVSTASSRTARPSNRSGSRAGSQVSSASSGTYRGGSRHGSQVSSASSGTWGGSSASSTSGRDRGGNAPASRAPQTYGSRVQELRGAPPPKDAKIKSWASNVSGGSGSTVSTSSRASSGVSRSSRSSHSSRHREVRPSDSVSQITPRYRKRTLENLERRGSRLASHDLDKLASLIARRYDHLQDLTRRHFDQDLEVFARDLDLDQLN